MQSKLFFLRPLSFRRVSKVLLISMFFLQIWIIVVYLPSLNQSSPYSSISYTPSLPYQQGHWISPIKTEIDSEIIESTNGTLPPSIPLYGFKYCVCLEGARFQTDVFVNDLNGKLTIKNKQTAVEILDQRSSELRAKFRDQVEKQNPMDEASAMRFTCFMSALAVTQWGNYAKSVWLDRINPKNYYPDIAFTPMPWRVRRKVKIAYLIMVHESAGSTRSLYKLIDALRGKDSVILIHADAKSWLLYERLKHFLRTSSPEIQEQVFLMDRRHPVQWGMASIVFAQLDGFFQLYDIAEWDFVINLSSNDYPLRSTEYIHQRLKRDHLYINHFEDEETMQTRIPTPHVVDAKQESPLRLAPDRVFVYRDIFPLRKHHQWMILPRGFIEYIRSTDHMSHNFLAWTEHGWVPDEHYFGTAALRKGGRYKDKVINDNKRFIGKFLADALHPKWLSTEDIPEIQDGLDEDRYFFARKIKIYEEHELIDWIDSERTGKSLAEMGHL